MAVETLLHWAVADVGVDANACADADDGVALVADMAMTVPRLNRHDPKIDYLIHDEDDQLDPLCLFETKIQRRMGAVWMMQPML